MTNDAPLTGYPALDALLADETISMIVVQGLGKTFVRRKGRMEEAPLTFDDVDHLHEVIQRIFPRYSPELLSLIRNTYLNTICVQLIPQPAPDGPVLSFRKSEQVPRLTAQDLIRLGSLTIKTIQLLQACVRARLNIIVSGGTSSGKTTLLNTLANWIPEDEHIVLVESREPLQLAQKFVTKLRPQRRYGQNMEEITMPDLVGMGLEMNPNRLVIDELTAGETLTFLRGINAGPRGMATLGANSPRAAVARLEVMCLMSGTDLPQRAIREQIAAAVDVICHQGRLRDGSRKNMFITEVQGMEGEMIIMSDLFEFEQTGLEAGRVIGRVRPTRTRPKFMDRIENAGIDLPLEVFKE
jgi:pilus assembly protein CpaF